MGSRIYTTSKSLWPCCVCRLGSHWCIWWLVDWSVSNNYSDHLSSTRHHWSVPHEAITWSNVDLLSFGPSGTKIGDIKMPTFSVKRMGSSANWRPLCSYFNVNFNQVMCIFQPLWYRYVRCVTSSPVQYELSVETHLKPKSREISLAHKSFPSYPTVLNICTEHGNGTAVLCTKVLNDWVM